ncbi:uncharacterized protein LOC106074315 isoform X8 [Biomphalaria glabrata]|uniref:Uncharacterized protein LOC106074315 isoform X8 n=1 Tax=Biomphalaria glabrata TaxID=6526 RepID=A0A9W2YSE1_BIOGL|nr:uncharacterized protein LOC106074315 isoform X8 [Biomphalaria glabrata]
MQIKEVFSLITIFFTIVSGSVYVQEVNEMTLTCNRNNNLMSIIINYDDGKQDLVATFNNTSCTTFGYMRCSYTSYNYFLAIPVKFVDSIMASYSCNTYISYNVYQYDAAEFNAVDKTNVTLVCPSSVDRSVLTLKYSNGQEEIMGYFKGTYSKCGLEKTCSVGDNKNIVSFLKEGSSVSLTTYGCSSYLITSETNIALTASDIQGAMSFTLSCSKYIYYDTLTLATQNGQRQAYATYTSKSCATMKPNMSCSLATNDIIFSIPVTTESRTVVSYSCYAGHSVDVIFYKAATSVQCQRPSISSTGDLFLLNCQASHFYPRLTCSMYEIKNSIKTFQSYTADYGNLVDSGSGFYYNSTCTLKMHISQLQQGSRQYGVVLTTATSTLGQNEYLLANINFAPLRAVLDNSCTEGQGMVDRYIHYTSIIYCMCRRDLGSNAFGQVFWFSDNVLVTSTTNSDNSSTLTVSYSTSFNQIYQCRALPFPDASYSATFTPQFAFGPTQVSLSRSTIQMNICSTEAFTCTVESNNASPGVVFNSSASSVNTVLRQTGSASLSATYAVKALKVERYTLTCKATNTLFDIYASGSISVTVLDVPLQDPVVIVNNNNPITEASEAVNITCYVSESVVAVKDVTIDCFGSSQTVSGSKATMFKKFNRDNSGMCFCTVRYVDDCFLSKRKEFQVIVAYGPTRLQISESRLALEICATETIICSVPTTDFNPEVDFSCTSDSPTSLNVERSQIDPSHGTATFSLTAQKSGDYTVTCRATNSMVPKMYSENSIVVSVEALTSRHPVISVTNKVLPLMEGAASSNVKISCTIPGGFQGVKSLTLNCLGLVFTEDSQPIMIERNITRANNDMICNCVVLYTSECLGQRIAKLDLKVMFGPSQAFLYPRSIDMEKCDQVGIGCNVLRADIYPGAMFYFSSVNTKAFQFNENSKMTTNISASINATALMTGSFAIKCIASNSVFNSIYTEASILATVREYPLKPPVFIVNDGNPITDKSVLSSLSILCVAGVNKRPLSKLTISCLNVTVTSKTSTVKIYKDITQDTKGTDCSCLAEYKDACNGETQSNVHFELKCTQPMLIINNGHPIIPGASGSRIPVVCDGIEDTNTESNITLTCLGSTQTSVGTTISIEKDVTQKDNGALCSCTIDSLYCSQKRTVQSAVNVSYFSGIDRFTVQGFETPQEVKENEQLTFICITQCNPKPNIMLKTKNDEVAELRNGDRITFTETTSGIWEYRLEVAAVSCADTGNYTCYAENLITATHLTKTSEIIVRCPFKVANEEVVQRKFIGYLDKTAVVSVNVYGYPLPKNFQLLRGSNESVDQNQFSFTYTEIAKPNILVNLKIYNLREDNFTTYTMIINNAEGQLQYQFSIIKDPTTSSNGDSDTMITAVSVVIVLAVLIIVITGICIYLKRNRNGPTNLNEERRNSLRRDTFQNRLHHASAQEEQEWQPPPRNQNHGNTNVLETFRGPTQINEERRNSLRRDTLQNRLHHANAQEDQELQPISRNQNRGNNNSETIGGPTQINEERRNSLRCDTIQNPFLHANAQEAILPPPPVLPKKRGGRKKDVQGLTSKTLSQRQETETNSYRPTTEASSRTPDGLEASLDSQSISSSNERQSFHANGEQEWQPSPRNQNHGNINIDETVGGPTQINEERRNSPRRDTLQNPFLHANAQEDQELQPISRIQNHGNNNSETIGGPTQINEERRNSLRRDTLQNPFFHANAQEGPTQINEEMRNSLRRDTLQNPFLHANAQEDLELQPISRIQNHGNNNSETIGGPTQINEERRNSPRRDTLQNPFFHANAQEGPTQINEERRNSPRRDTLENPFFHANAQEDQELQPISRIQNHGNNNSETIGGPTQINEERRNSPRRDTLQNPFFHANAQEGPTQINEERRNSPRRDTLQNPFFHANAQEDQELQPISRIQNHGNNNSETIGGPTQINEERRNSPRRDTLQNPFFHANAQEGPTQINEEMRNSLRRDTLQNPFLHANAQEGPTQINEEMRNSLRRDTLQNPFLHANAQEGPTQINEERRNSLQREILQNPFLHANTQEDQELQPILRNQNRRNYNSETIGGPTNLNEERRNSLRPDTLQNRLHHANAQGDQELQPISRNQNRGNNNSETIGASSRTPDGLEASLDSQSISSSNERQSFHDNGVRLSPVPFFVSYPPTFKRSGMDKDLEDNRQHYQSPPQNELRTRQKASSSFQHIEEQTRPESEHFYEPIDLTNNKRETEA